jgi:hypothetical protein
VRRFNRATVRKALRTSLDDWRGLLTENVAEARPLLSVVPAGDRIAFQPLTDGRYKLSVPIAFDRMLVMVVPELAGLQDLGTLSNVSRMGGGVIATGHPTNASVARSRNSLQSCSV